MKEFPPPKAAVAAVGSPVGTTQPKLAPDSAFSGRVLANKEDNAKPQVSRFLALAGQLGLLWVVFFAYDTLGGTDWMHDYNQFLRLSALAFGAFLVHYWLPFRFKEVFWVAISMAGAFLFLNSRVAELLIGAGLLFFLILRGKLPFRVRASLVALVFAGLIYCCAHRVEHIPWQFYPVFGALFMFRIIIYLYDLSHSKEPARLLPFLSYFFILPNYLVPFFPVIDFQTMRHTYFQRNIHDIAQQGIRWMMRGAVQLALYRVVVYFNDSYLPDRVTNPGSLAATLVLTYMLYLNVSGHFHMVVGMMHLFGYDLPETNRRYFLAGSVLDFWRRINIYWKDFMVKIVYFPVYFKLRKKGDLKAQVLATAAVFQVTILLHVYQFFWTKRQFECTVPDLVFFNALGLAAIGQVLYDGWRKREKRAIRKPGPLAHALQVACTFAFVSILWSFWSAHTASSGIYLLTHWARGGR
jgi:alginate O-acetyltransferase complex protein AlgI